MKKEILIQAIKGEVDIDEALLLLLFIAIAAFFISFCFMSETIEQLFWSIVVAVMWGLTPTTILVIDIISVISEYKSLVHRQVKK